jgi:hypothetical protein
LIVERVCSRDTIRRMDRPAAAADVACRTFTPLRHTAVHPHGAGAFVVFVHDSAYYGPPSAVSVQLCTPPHNCAHRHNLLLEADDLRFLPDRRISKPAIQPDGLEFVVRRRLGAGRGPCNGRPSAHGSGRQGPPCVHWRRPAAYGPPTTHGGVPHCSKPGTRQACVSRSRAFQNST